MALLSDVCTAAWHCLVTLTKHVLLNANTNTCAVNTHSFRKLNKFFELVL